VEELNELLDELEMHLDGLDEQKIADEKATAETTERIKTLVGRLKERNSSEEEVETPVIADTIVRENVSD
jgi:hypothetical protein